jgi:hypothetical protein
LSRAISIGYEVQGSGRVSIDTPGSMDVLGGQRSSMRFWALPRLREAGIERLTILGETDPVIFWGWEDMNVLRRELDLLEQVLPSLDFDDACKKEWMQRLRYCYDLLIKTAPPHSAPTFMIG